MSVLGGKADSALFPYQCRVRTALRARVRFSLLGATKGQHHARAHTRQDAPKNTKRAFEQTSRITDNQALSRDLKICLPSHLRCAASCGARTLEAERLKSHVRV